VLQSVLYSPGSRALFGPDKVLSNCIFWIFYSVGAPSFAFSSGVEFYPYVFLVFLEAVLSCIHSTQYSVLWCSQTQSAEHNFHQMVRKCSPINNTSAPTSPVIICEHWVLPLTFWKYLPFLLFKVHRHWCFYSPLPLGKGNGFHFLCSLTESGFKTIFFWSFTKCLMHTITWCSTSSWF
jgi:hypothetical protein